MLTPECLRFRDRFAAERIDPDNTHRRSCPACSSWAFRLEQALQPTPGVAMPPGLQRRLAAIAILPADCAEVDRRYSESGRAPNVGADPSEGTADRDQHLLSCERCRKVYGLLASACSAAQAPLPTALRLRLQLRTEPVPKLPPWIRDSRYAAAACYGLTFFLLFLAGDSSARFRDTVDRVGTRASEVFRDGETQGRSAWMGVRTWTDQSIELGLLRVEPWRDQMLTTWQQTTETIGELDPDRLRSRLRPKRGADDERNTASSE